MYLFIDETQIEPYNGEILKRYVGNKLVKVIANPTDNDLIEFGYKYVVDTGEMPEEKDGYYIEPFYTDGDVITKNYRYVELPSEE